MRCAARLQSRLSPRATDGLHWSDSELMVFAGCSRGSYLRAHLPIEVLGVENVIVQVGDPLAPRGRQAQIFHPLLEMSRDRVPVKSGKLLHEVGRGSVTVLPVAAELLELVEQRIGLPRIEGIAKLPDQIGGLNQPRLESGLIGVRSRRREAGQFDGGGDTVGVDRRRLPEALVNEQLRSINMIGGKRRGRGSARQA